MRATVLAAATGGISVFACNSTDVMMDIMATFSVFRSRELVLVDSRQGTKWPSDLRARWC